MSFRQHFRDVKEWESSTNGNIKLKTSSDEAAKLYDASLTQFLGWYDDASLGGLDATVSKMVKADKDFVLGKALALELELLGGTTSPEFDPQLASRIDEFCSMFEKLDLDKYQQESYHHEVVKLLAKNDLKSTINVLEQLVTLYPEDVAGLKMIQDLNFFRGTALPMRNSLANSLARMTDKNPLKGYVHGMYSFALEESNMYSPAQVQASKALELIPRDTWAIHNYAHCLEMQGKSEEGLKWMQDRKVDWSPCQMLACHQYWHTALFHINNNQFDEAIDVLDNDVLSRCVENCTTLDIHDAASMIYRMELVDLFGKANKSKQVDCRERWRKVHKICKAHKTDHLNGFNDTHYMMSFLGMNDLDSANESLRTISPGMIRSNPGLGFAKQILEAMVLYKDRAYDKVVDILAPIRFEIINIGGSHAQRDVFEQLLLVAARRSSQLDHNKLGERMLTEREIFHGRRLPQTELLANA